MRYEKFPLETFLGDFQPWAHKLKRVNLEVLNFIFATGDTSDINITR